MKYLISAIVAAVMLMGLGFATEIQAATLKIRVDGKIGVGDPCPKERWESTYSDLQTAIDCARDGDRILIRSGTYFWPYTVAVNKRLKIKGDWRPKPLLYTGT